MLPLHYIRYQEPERPIYLLSSDTNDILSVMESQDLNMPDPADYGKLFTKKMLMFIEELPKHKTKKAACDAIGIASDTVHVWCGRSQAFKIVYEDLMSRMDEIDISFNRDAYMHDVVLPNSLLRIGEIVTQPITPSTSLERQKLIANVALKVAQGRGYLDSGGGITIKISELAAEANRTRAYKPAWMVQRAIANRETTTDDDSEQTTSSVMKSIEG